MWANVLYLYSCQKRDFHIGLTVFRSSTRFTGGRRITYSSATWCTTAPARNITVLARWFGKWTGFALSTFAAPAC